MTSIATMHHIIPTRPVPLILGESYSPWVWAALALMMVGLFLVTPRPGTTTRVPTGISLSALLAPR